MAQTAQGAQAPESYVLDSNSVDVMRGAHTFSVTDVAIGPEGSGLAYARTVSGDRHRSTFDGLIEVEFGGEPAPGVQLWQYTVSIGPKTSLFQTTGATLMTSSEGDGSTLEYVAPSTYTHIDRDGVIRTFSGALANENYIPPQYTPPAGEGGRVVQMVKPNGERWDWHYRSATGTTPSGFPAVVHRVQSVTSTLGYQIKFEYAQNATPTTPEELISFGTLTKTLGINNAVDWCDPAADVCTGLTQTWPQAQYVTTPVQYGYRIDVTDLLDQTTGYTYAGQMGMVGFLQSIDFPEPGRADLTLGYTDVDGEPRVASYSDGRGVWLYDYIDVNQTFRDTVITDPNNEVTRYRVRVRFGPPPGPFGDYTYMQRLNYMIDPMGARTDLRYDANERLTEIWFPEGDKAIYTRDGRGNITQVRRIAKPSAPAADIITSWTYPTSCDPTNRPTCNQPLTATDALGAVYDYTYDAVHGGLLSETRPADPSGVRPQTRYTYLPLQAWRRTSSSPVQVAAPPVVFAVQTSTCSAGAAPACLGTAQEHRTTTTYQAGSSSTGSNLLPVIVAAGAGDGSLTASTNTTWTYAGDPKTIDGPLSGSADTTFYVYDLLRRKTGVISPDPDAGGPLPFPASRTIYNADGQPVRLQQGTVSAQSDTSLENMTVLSEVRASYDAQARKTQDIQILGTSKIGLAQYNYDNEGRVLCAVVRMNPEIFDSLPSNACALGESGAFGEDRITRNSYDFANRLTQVELGVGTSVAQVSRLQAWTPNGKIDWVEDANHNRTDYTYDGFDRVSRVNFPLSATGARAANPDDYEQYTYDANNNLLTRRLRDGQFIVFSYDALGRESVKTVPGGGTADDVFTTYDLMDRRLTATFIAPGSTANGIVWTWDALGRPLTETAYGRTLASTYDVAGRRTLLTWPDGASWVSYGWDLANRMTVIEQSPVGLTTIGQYTYDSLGRRTSFSRHSGGATSWSYIPNSRNWSMTHDLVGTANDVTLTLTFNPAGQAVSRDTSNPAYQYTLPTQATTPYVRDGLNQYDSVAGTAFVHDARGNLTSDGARAYGYDAENRLVSVYQGGAPQLDLVYDPLGRIKSTSAPAGVVQYVWDGDRLVAEYDDKNALLARYAHGPGPDEPLADWLDDQNPTYFLSDHQNSIIGLDRLGTLIGTPFTYDPYGQPDPAHGFGGPRFRYTGQTALVPAVPLWHYKARAYDPGVGRFLQIDPVGYEGSLNLYQYVDNNPLNAADPTGALLYSNGSSGCVVNCFGSGLADMIMLAQDPVVIREPAGFNESGTIAYYVVKNAETGEVLRLEGLATGRVNDAISPLDFIGPGALFNVGRQSGLKVLATQGNRAIVVIGRAAYVTEVRLISGQVQWARLWGASAEEQARLAHGLRRSIGERYKNWTPEPLRSQIRDRNMERYGDPLGPSVEWLRARGYSWQDIATGASRTGGRDLGL